MVHTTDPAVCLPWRQHSAANSGGFRAERLAWRRWDLHISIVLALSELWGADILTDIFLSHAKADKKLVDEFVDLLVTGIGVSGRKGAIFASSVAGRGVSSAVDYRTHIMDRLKEAKLAIFLVSPNFYSSTFAMAELSIAWAAKANSFILLVPPLTPSKVKDFFGNLQLAKLNNTNSLNELCDHVQATLKLDSDVARWSDRSREFRKSLPSLVKPTEPQKTTTRTTVQPTSDNLTSVGTWSQRVVDAQRVVDGMIYIANGYTTINIKKALLTDIGRGKVLSPVFSYLTNNGYHNWMDLTRDPTYEYYSHAVELYRRRSDALVECITKASGSTLDVISLGPGEGSKDRLFLRALARKKGAESILYYPFDVSESMISTSMRTVGQDKDLADISVKAVLADFNALPEFRGLFQQRRTPSVFLLLGNTIGNLTSERTFLRELHNNAMAVNDILVLEVCNQKGVNPQREYSERNKKFDFGGLEYLGVNFEPDRLTYTPDEGTSNIPGTQTTVARYNEQDLHKRWPDAIEKPVHNVTLSYIHRYDPQQLIEQCERIFDYVDIFEHESATITVLKKTTDTV